VIVMATYPNLTAAKIASSAVAGFVAGVVMVLCAMTQSGALGLGFWLPVQSIAATFFGVEALIGGLGSVVIGLSAHVVMSLLAGGIFGALISSESSRGVIVALALAYGVLLWAAMTFLALPLINEVMLERVLLAPVWWFVLHLIYGLVLGLVVAQRKGEQFGVIEQPIPAQ
jgi:hypothetical protein